MKKIMRGFLMFLIFCIPVVSEAATTEHTKTVQITPKPGYQVTDVLINGISKGVQTSWTFSNIVEAQTLEVLTELVGYPVTFNANGGVGTMENQNIGKMSRRLSKNTFTKESCVFEGWSTTASGEVEYEDEDMCYIIEPTTLYAVWGLYGDVNDDGRVDSGDTLKIDQYGNKCINPKRADVNLDGNIDFLDSKLILQKSVGLIDSFPYNGIAIYNDDGIIKMTNESSLGITYAELDSKFTPETVGFFIGKWGENYIKPGETIQVFNSGKVYPVLAEMVSNSSPNTVRITYSVDSSYSSHYFLWIDGTEYKNSGSVDVPFGTIIYFTTRYNNTIYINGKQLKYQGMGGGAIDENVNEEEHFFTAVRDMRIELRDDTTNTDHGCIKISY